MDVNERIVCLSVSLSMKTNRATQFNVLLFLGDRSLKDTARRYLVFRPFVPRDFFFFLSLYVRWCPVIINMSPWRLHRAAAANISESQICSRDNVIRTDV